MLDKKVTRKQFLLSALSVVAIVAARKVPSVIRKTVTGKKEGNTYGNNSYGGSINA